MKNIVITGSSRGIGRALALEFLKAGCHVVLSSRHMESLQKAVHLLGSESGSKQVSGIVCDVCKRRDLQELWIFASKSVPVDIWINNAGINHPGDPFHNLEETMLSNVIETNITGTVLGSRVAIEGMLEQGTGSIYNMEGFGSDGRILKGMSVYGTSKNAVRYFTRSLIKEYKAHPVRIGSISPGMLVTDMLLEPLRRDPEGNRESLKIFHILADPVERVTPWLARKILSNSKHGASIKWLTPSKVAFRFTGAMFNKRKVKGLPES